MAQARLHYFDGFGRAECTRIILRFTGTEFEDNRHTDDTFAEFKAQGISEFGQVPMLQIDGHNLVQSRAIEKYLLRKAGVVTNDPVTEYKSESLIGFLEDVIMAISKFVWVDKDFEGLNK